MSFSPGERGLEQNFTLEIGSVSETVTVSAEDLKLNITDVPVSAVVDRQFEENLPMNGRSSAKVQQSS